MMYLLPHILNGLTLGLDGLLGIPRPSLELGFASVDMSSNVALFYLAAAILMAAVRARSTPPNGRPSRPA